MRVLFAPDSFTGTLTAAQATAAMIDGWRRTRPDDELLDVPMSDGGPCFVEAVTRGWARFQVAFQTPSVEVIGPTGAPIAATFALNEGTAFIESAQVCGVDLIDVARRDPWRQSSRGLGQICEAAIGMGAERMVVGLGGTGTIDAGLGFLGALGARAFDAQGHDASPALLEGPAAFERIAWIDMAPAIRTLAGVDLVIASDVDVPLLGPNGAARGFGAQKFPNPTAVDEVELIHLDAVMGRVAGLAQGGMEMADLMGRPGAGAAGGLGWALLAVGGVMTSGSSLVLSAVSFEELIGDVDLVVTGEGSLDWQSRRGKVVTAVAEAAAQRGIPVIALAGRVDLGDRELAAHGIVEARSLSDHAGGLAQALAAPAAVLAQVAGGVAEQWSTGRR